MKILFLGASFFQLAPIRYAVNKGYVVVTCDNCPENEGHKYAAVAWNISIRDKEKILAQVVEYGGVDAVVAYASDPAAPTAAWLCEQLGLRGVCSYTSSCIMTYKNQWRMFLGGNGFNCPQVFHFINGMREEIAERVPFIVKPCASSGSRGVSIVRKMPEFDSAVNAALEYSHGGGIIFEELIGCDGYQIAGDGFVVDGRLAFYCFANEHFAKVGDGVVPMGESFPWGGLREDGKRIARVIQKALDLLQFRNGALNFDIRIYRGRIYLMEIGARAGGNLIAEAIKEHCGVDLAAAVVESALGNKVELEEGVTGEGGIATYMIHAQKSGVYKGLEINGLGAEIISQRMFVKEGDVVEGFTGSNKTLGTMILKFERIGGMMEQMERMEEIVKVGVE